jgi:NADH dehydrogenase
MGRFAAEQIKRIEAGQPTETFHYHDKGQAATIGRKSAVIELAHGPDLTGTLAWLGWLGLHFFYLIGGRNRVSAIINLAWRYVSWGHGGTVIVGDEPSLAAQPEPAAYRPGAERGSPSRVISNRAGGLPQPGGEPGAATAQPAGQPAVQPAGQPSAGSLPQHGNQAAGAQAGPSATS